MIPASTYRVQLNAGFTFDDLAQVIDYLRELGVGALYLSPILKALPGSRHGYDIVDHAEFNPEIVPPGSLERFVSKLNGMGVVLDVVPNHMCISDRANWRWQDVLENGPSSPQSAFFDIEWRPPRPDLENKVLLPILGDQYGVVLENGEIQIEYADGAFTVRYHTTVLPASPGSWRIILSMVLEKMKEQLAHDDPAVIETTSILTAIGYLPRRTETDAGRVVERQREIIVIKSRIASLMENSPECRAALDSALRRINGDRGDPASFDVLEEILSQQAYRLSFWRVAADEINYRRFFDINELAAIRVEDERVFEAVHARYLECIHDGWVTGFRIDHSDGLSDPVSYFERVREAVAPSEPFYLVAEKIMLGDEQPRPNWAIDGTTGYDFLNSLNGLFVDPAAETSLNSIYDKFTGNTTSFDELSYRSKRLILRIAMSSELNVLSRRLDRICQQHRHTRDFTLDSLRFALREIISCFPVYRTYIRENQNEVEAEDRRHIDHAIDEAKKRNAASSSSVFDAIRRILLLEDPPGTTPEQVAERRLFVMRFQQLTGPVMAKGVEDTAFYRRFPLASLNEVGADPTQFGTTPTAFHQRVLRSLEHQPHSMLSTSTHDTKRSEDVRARLNVLSEIPDEWAAAIERWHALTRPYRTRVDGFDAPERNTEYLFFQTLVGAWPLYDDDPKVFACRMKSYLTKATREAKTYTSWLNPEQEYDAAIHRFATETFSDEAFVRDIRSFARSITRPGLMNSLSQTVLKLMSPGVPDIYQGNEVWDFSLVDPDNRRPVDFGMRAELLRTVRDADARDLLSNLEDGRVKLFVTQKLLCLRREYTLSGYQPLTAFGDQKEHVVAFARSTTDNRTAIVAAGRFFVRLGCRETAPVGEQVWGDSALVVPGEGTFVNVLTGQQLTAVQYRGRNLVPLSEVFGSLPVAVLMTQR